MLNSPVTCCGLFGVQEFKQRNGTILSCVNQFFPKRQPCVSSAAETTASWGVSRLTVYYRTRFYVPQKAVALTNYVRTLHVTHSFCSGRSDHKRFHHPGACQHAESGQQASHPTAQIQPASSQHREHGKLCQRGADTVSGAASEGKETKQKELARDESSQT